MNVHVLLGPTVNLHRSPLGGRGFECYSEDPLLSGRMATAWISGVQSRGVAASPKHFVGNDSETRRTTIDCIIDERALRELYLVPFEYAVHAGAWTLMAAYNRMNGVYATEQRGLLGDLLKDEWDWDGLVISDWGAAHDTVSCALAGLDLEMPRGRVLGAALGHAVDAGMVSEAELDDKVDRLLRLAGRVRTQWSGDLHARCDVASGANAKTGGEAEDQQTLLSDAAAAGFVLLKNDAGLLPLDVGRGQGPLAVIGPNASDPCYQGGGSAWVNTGQLSNPLSALVDRYRGFVEVTHERGCVPRTSFRPLGLSEVQTTGSAPEAGLTVAYLADGGDPIQTLREVRRSSFLSWYDGISAFPDGTVGDVLMSCWLLPERSGDYELSVRGSGATSVSIDGVQVAALAPQADEQDSYAALFSQETGRGSVWLTARVPVLLEARMRHVPAGIPMFEVGCRSPQPDDLFDRAVGLAAAARAVVLVVGTSSDVEAESIDRTTTSLPGGQDALVEAILDANARTVVVVNAGSAVAMPWIDKASTVLYTWFPGHGFADALVSVISGEREPGGRLPMTLAAAPEQYPAYATTPDADGRLVYRESVFVGYRHLDAQQLEPTFPFGHGLSYTRFDYGPLKLSTQALAPGETLMASLTLTNAGERAGKEVVQLYVSPGVCEVPRPERELKAFAAVHLNPGESRLVELELGPRAFAYWDPELHCWHVSAGSYGIHVGRSSRDLRQAATLTVADALFTGGLSVTQS